MTSQWSDKVSASVVLDETAQRPEQIAACTDAFVRAYESRLPGSRWEVIDGPSWAGAPEELADVVRTRPSRAATGDPDPTDGYSFTLYADRSPVTLSVGVDVGGRFVGRRLPQQNVRGSIVNPRGVPVEPALGEALLESLIEAWNPLFGRISDADVFLASGRGRWKLPAGYRVWLRDGIATFTSLAEGVTTRPFAGGTMISVPDDWPPDLVANRLAETYERNGVDEVPHPQP